MFIKVYEQQKINLSRNHKQSRPNLYLEYRKDTDRDCKQILLRTKQSALKKMRDEVAAIEKQLKKQICDWFDKGEENNERA